MDEICAQQLACYIKHSLSYSILVRHNSYPTLYVPDVLLGAGATLLENIKTVEGSNIGACSMVLEDIPAYSVGVGEWMVVSEYLREWELECTRVWVKLSGFVILM